MVDRYPGKRTEYGGGDGAPQRLPDGTPIPLQDLADGASTRARLMRQVGMADFDVNADDVVGAAATGINPANMSQAQREAYDKDLALSKKRAAQRKRLSEATNGYSEVEETYIGEGGENNGVQPFGE